MPERNQTALNPDDMGSRCCWLSAEWPAAPGSTPVCPAAPRFARQNAGLRAAELSLASDPGARVGCDGNSRRRARLQELLLIVPRPLRGRFWLELAQHVPQCPAGVPVGAAPAAPLRPAGSGRGAVAGGASPLGSRVPRLREPPASLFSALR